SPQAWRCMRWRRPRCGWKSCVWFGCCCSAGWRSSLEGGTAEAHEVKHVSHDLRQDFRAEDGFLHVRIVRPDFDEDGARVQVLVQPRVGPLDDAPEEPRIARLDALGQVGGEG